MSANAATKGHVHILGIAGTFMGSLAQIAKAQGYRVSGRDHAIYPPMSDQLAQAGIEVLTDMDAPLPDDAEIIVGNVMRRGMPVIEALLAGQYRYRSGPQWLGEEILCDRFVLAVAGTHGKTTTTAMLAWILEHAGMSPGFLIGGVPANFGVSARLDESPFFVIEADEYDTAFFDKRSKFLHYRPRGVVLNNLEYDHADIFDDLAAIERQFAHLLRLVPDNGVVIRAADEPALDRVIDQGCWSPVERFGEARSEDGAEDSASDEKSGWQLRGRHVSFGGDALGELPDSIVGRHNRRNAIAALALARFAGVPPEHGLAALAEFRGVARRLQLRGQVRDIRVYDDFAHHPTAIAETIAALREEMPPGVERLVAVVDPRSNTMRAGVHADRLAEALAGADKVIFHAPDGLAWSPHEALAPLTHEWGRLTLASDVETVLATLLAMLRAGDRVLIMSNGDFGGLHERLLQALRQAAADERGGRAVTL